MDAKQAAVLREKVERLEKNEREQEALRVSLDTVAKTFNDKLGLIGAVDFIGAVSFDELKKMIQDCLNDKIKKLEEEWRDL